MNTLKENSFVIFLKKHKWKILIFLLITFIVFVIWRIENTKTPVQNIKPSTPTPEASQNIEVPTTNNKEQSYFINQVTTNFPPVTGYSWSGNVLVYSNPNGVYKAGTNEVVVEKPIQKINWGNGGIAVFKSENVWYKADINKNIIPLNKNFTNPIINSKGNQIIDSIQNKLYVYSLDDLSEKEHVFDESVIKYIPAENSETIVVSTEFGGKTTIHQINTKLEEDFQKKLDKNYTLSSISPDGNTIALTFNNELLITNFSSDINTETFLPNSKLFTSFRNLNELIVIEKYKDSLGRTLENIYELDTKGKIFKISDSRPIKNRLNTGIPIMFNSIKNISTFSENDGKIWILSLIPNIYPTYSTEGNLIYSDIKPYSH